MFISLFLLKMFPTICDETLCKFLFCTYEDSLNLIWSRISRGHVVDIYIALVENGNFKIAILGYLKALQGIILIIKVVSNFEKIKRKVTFVF